MVDTELEKKLGELHADFVSVTGTSFKHFFCPIQFVDEDTALCKGHVVNQAFPNSTRCWTIQRKDVDNFYGSFFEADFAALLYKEGGTPTSVLFDKKLSQLFDVSITAGGEPVDHYFTKGKIPEHFTGVEVHKNDGTRLFLGLKMDPESVFQKVDQQWETSVSKDIRVAALVSLIKSGYLTLFHMLGYQYALSVSGLSVGYHVLGQFFKSNVGKSKQTTLDAAREFFGQYAHMVRPIAKTNLQLAGTVDDGNIFLCKTSSGEPWASVVFVRTSQQLHAVLLPQTESEAAYRIFMSFLRDAKTTLRGNFLKFNQEHWAANPKVDTLEWPKGEALLE